MLARTKHELQMEVLDLRARLQSAQEALSASRVEAMDNPIVLGPNDDLTVILKCAVEPYRLMVEVMSEGAVTCTSDGTIIYCNASFAKLLKVETEQVIGFKLQEFIAEKDQSSFEEVLSASLLTPVQSQLGMKAEGDSIIPVQCSTNPLKVGTSACIAAVFTDLSKIVGAAALMSRLSMIVESSEDAIVGTTLEGVIESWNKSAERLFGYSKEEAVGKEIQTLVVPPERLEEAEARMESIRRNEYEKPFEAFRRRIDGTVVAMSVSASPINDENGRPTGISIIYRDITEQKQHEAIIRELNGQLEQRVIERTAQLEAANKELEAFSYSVSHDLRAPLRSLSGFSRIVLEEHGKNLDEDGKDCLRRISAAAERMSLLIDELLKLSRIGRTQMKYEWCDLTEMADFTIDELRQQPEHRSVEVRIQKEMHCQGDSPLLLIVLQNLLRNAWKFTSRREKALIEVGCAEKDGELVYFVRDNGAGFDMEYANKLFGVFQRLHSFSEFEGVGIGLSIVKRIIGRHNGRVWAEGAIDKGATFYFTIGDCQ